MIMMNPQSSEVHIIIGNGKYSESDTAQTVPVGDPNPNIACLFYGHHDDTAVQHLEASLEPYLNVCLNDSVSPTVCAFQFPNRA